jgi:hypothetical protein
MYQQMCNKERSTIKVIELRHISILFVCRPQGMYIKISIKIPEDKPQERVETYWSCNVLIANILCYISFVGIFFSFNKSVYGCTSICCVQYMLCTVYVVYSIFCVQYLLCAVFVVYNICCVQYMLCTVNNPF